MPRVTDHQEHALVDRTDTGQYTMIAISRAPQFGTGGIAPDAARTGQVTEGQPATLLGWFSVRNEWDSHA